MVDTETDSLVEMELASVESVGDDQKNTNAGDVGSLSLEENKRQLDIQSNESSQEIKVHHSPRSMTGKAKTKQPGGILSLSFDKAVDFTKDMQSDLQKAWLESIRWRRSKFRVVFLGILLLAIFLISFLAPEDIVIEEKSWSIAVDRYARPLRLEFDHCYVQLSADSEDEDTVHVEASWRKNSGVRTRAEDNLFSIVDARPISGGHR